MLVKLQKKHLANLRYINIIILINKNNEKENKKHFLNVTRHSLVLFMTCTVESMLYFCFTNTLLPQKYFLLTKLPTYFMSLLNFHIHIENQYLFCANYNVRSIRRFFCNFFKILTYMLAKYMDLLFCIERVSYGRTDKRTFHLFVCLFNINQFK